MTTEARPVRHPLVWVPSLYFAQGLPFAIVAMMASIMYKKLGISNEEITYWTGLLGFAWVFKPLWSPFLELVGSKKAVVVTFQALGGVLLLACGLTLQLPGFFTFSIAVLALGALSSATHDIAADGLYIQSLSKHQQTIYSGWLGAFWNGGKLFVLGALVRLAGELELRFSMATAWSATMAFSGVLLLGLAAYHAWSIPARATGKKPEVTAAAVATTTREVVVSFFAKPGIWVAILFILLFRVGEGQVQSIGRLFLLEKREAGGLGLSTVDMAAAYGTSATVAFIGGSILGGYFAAWLGLKRSMFLLILAMNLPSLTFWYLAAYAPANLYLITGALSLEMFGYGFGFVGLTLFLMQVVAPGKFVTAHYAVGTGVMALGFVLSQMVSGKVQALLGYQSFFVWSVLAAAPALVLSFIVPLPGKPEAEPEPIDAGASEPSVS